MAEFGYLEKEKSRLLNFCISHDHIYIYGAGRYGKKYLEVLCYQDIDVSGFITTNGEIREYCGLPVYSAKEISTLITNQDGVIPAYLNSTVEAVRKKFNFIKPDVLSFEHQVMCFLHADIKCLPIIRKLKEEFPLPGSFRKTSEWENILVIRLDAIGDVICTTAFIRELKRCFPKSKITVVIRRQNELLLRKCPYIDNLILYESNLKNEGFLGEIDQFDSIKNRIKNFTATYFEGKCFDAVFLPREILCGRNTTEEFLIALYSRANYRGGRLIDAGDYQRWVYHLVKDFFSHICYQTEPMHESKFQLDMLKCLGFDARNDKLELWIDETNRKFAENILSINSVKKQDKLIALGLVGSLSVKTWKIENYERLIHRFHEKYGTLYKFILFGGTDAVESAKQLTEDTEIIIDLTGKLGLDMTTACMEKCDIYVGGNTGLLHIATAMGKPSVTLYMVLKDAPDICQDGPQRWGSMIENSIELLPPPGLDGCYGICKKRYSHCINQITPIQVEQAIESILNTSTIQFN